VVFLATGLSLVIGVPLGLISGYLGGKLDRVLLFLMDTLYTLPGLLLSVALAFVLGRGILNVAIAVSIAYIPQYFRVVRNQTASVKNELFIEAARAIGASPSRILSKYLFFNVVQSVPVLFTLNAADAILVLGGLGFLGLGLPEEVPEWGHDLKEALADLSTGIWWTTLFPGLAMTTMVVGLSLLGEGLSEIVNPLSRKR
jgi:peptide/nickel transport system permease protein